MKLIITLLTCALATGCITKRYYPVPVQEDTAELRLIMSDSTEALTNGLAPATSATQAKKQMQAYATWYLHMATKIKQDEYRHGDASLSFGILGLAAGALESVEGAGLGALLASGANLPVSRYQMAVQSKNYENASDAMYCMFSHLATLDDAHLPSSTFLNERVYEVRRKLRKAQMQIALASPDQQDLKAKITAAVRTSAATQQAIQAADAAERTVNQHRASLASSENAQSLTQSNTLMRTLAQAEEAMQKAKEQKALLTKAQAEKELTACIASFSS